MRRGVHQHLVTLIIEPHGRESDPTARTNQAERHGDRLVEQTSVFRIEIAETQRFLALADGELALLRSVSDSAKIGYRETF